MSSLPALLQSNPTPYSVEQTPNIPKNFLSQQSVLIIFVTGVFVVGVSYAARTYAVAPYSAIAGACLVTAAAVFTVFLSFFNRTFETFQLKVDAIRRSLAAVEEQRAAAEQFLKEINTEKATLATSLATVTEEKSKTIEDCKILDELLKQRNTENQALQTALDEQTAEIAAVIREKDRVDSLRQNAEEQAESAEKRIRVKVFGILAFIRGDEDSAEVKTELEERYLTMQHLSDHLQVLQEVWEREVRFCEGKKNFYQKFVVFLERTPANERTDCFKQGSLSLARACLVCYSEGQGWATSGAGIFATLREGLPERMDLVSERRARGNSRRSAGDIGTFGWKKYASYLKSCSAALQELDRLIDILNKKLASLAKLKNTYREAENLFRDFAKREESAPLEEETLSILFDIFPEQEFKEGRRGESETVALAALSERYLQGFQSVEENLQQFKKALEAAERFHRDLEEEKSEAELHIEFFRSYGCSI